MAEAETRDYAHGARARCMRYTSTLGSPVADREIHGTFSQNKIAAIATVKPEEGDPVTLIGYGDTTFPQQTPGRGAACESLLFNPWNGHQEMRPLGNMNRGRSPIYHAAEAYRQGR